MVRDVNFKYYSFWRIGNYFYLKTFKHIVTV